METTPPQVDPKALAKAVAPFESTEPWQGLLKFFILFIPVLIGGKWLIFDSPDLLTMSLVTVPFAFIYASLLITTHDAIHTTLTGFKLFDEIAPRLISWPVYSIHSVYQEVHKLHHNMNGSNLSDPERVQYSVSEYESSSKAMKFFIRNQWLFNLFVFTGVGFISKTAIFGANFFKTSKTMRRAFFIDALGIALMSGIILTLTVIHERVVYYALWYFLTQYVVGFILQLRAHVEHYGLWGKGKNFYDTQVWNCRNMKVPYYVSWYFNFLSFHTIHHAFPRVPFYKLKDAQNAMRAVYEKSGLTIPESDLGYIKQSLDLARNPVLIDDRKPQFAGQSTIFISSLT